MKSILKRIAVALLGITIGVGFWVGVVYGGKYIFRDEIRAAQQERDLDKYICDKAKGHIYYLTDEDGKKQRVCLTEQGIVR